MLAAQEAPPVPQREAEPVAHTYPATVWFFVIYVVVIAVLFSQLFVGIILRMFELAREQRK